MKNIHSIALWKSILFKAALSLSIIIIFYSCYSIKELLVRVNPTFSQFIESYTSGVISKTGSIKIN